jgi:class 3 adenylate cyclase/tetratricopeptide (TPR) repeat protein
VPKLPSGTITFLFTDIEGSTQLWEQYPEAMREALARHDALLQEAIAARGGRVFKKMGDALCAAFTNAPAAVSAALAAQLAVHEEPWPEPVVLRLRMALHTGYAEEQTGDYLGPPLNRVARLLGIGHAGQVLLSEVTRDLCFETLPPEASLLALGEHGLEDLGRPEQVYQLVHPDLRSHFPELRSVSSSPGESSRGGTPTLPSSGPLPPIWNVPHRRNPNFTGREELLAGVEAALVKGGPAALTQAIVGLGGVGKTQCALEYAYRHAGDYSTVWWVHAGEPVQLAAGYAALADSLNLPEQQSPSQGVIVSAVRSWLERNGRWLLVFDNAPGPEAMASYLPRVPRGHVIITSRDQNWGKAAAAVAVPVLPRNEATAFLAQRTGWSGSPVAELVEALGGLPLALEQAAAYAIATGCSASAYLGVFRSRRQALLRREQPPEGYQETVATTWGMAMAEAARECPAAAGLLALCAYLAPDDIPLFLVAEGVEHCPGPLAEATREPLLLHDAVAALRRYSLVSVHQDTLSVHRLVQAVVRDGLSEGERAVWASTAVQVVLAGFPEEAGDVRNWPACASRLPHALAATDLAIEAGQVPEETRDLLLRAGRHLLSRADRDLGGVCLDRALEFVERVRGPEHPALIPVLERLAEFRSWDPKPYLDRALAIAERALGPVHPDLARLLAKVGGLGIHDESIRRAHFARALAIAEGTEGPEGRLAADVHARFGNALAEMTHFAEGRAESEKALALFERVLPPDDPRVARQHADLGFVLGYLAEFAAEKHHFERALALSEQAFGSDHPEVAQPLKFLGLVSFPAFGDLVSARACLERAVSIYEGAFGTEHPYFGWALHNLAVVLHLQGDLVQARSALERGLSIVPDDYLYHLLGRVLLGFGDLGGAKAQMERAVVVVKEWSGRDDHECELEVLPSLARVYRLQGDLRSARAYLEHSLGIEEALYPPHQTRLAATRREYGLLLQAEGDLVGAREHLRKAVAQFESCSGPQHPLTVQARRDVAAVDGECV